MDAGGGEQVGVLRARIAAIAPPAESPATADPIGVDRDASP